MNPDAYRTATLADVDAIVQLVNHAYRPAPGAAGWTHESELVSGDRIDQQAVRDAISKEGSIILLGIQELRIEACIQIEKTADASYIGMLAVNPRLQGINLGKRMLAQAEALAQTRFGSQKFILVVVSARSELIAFYLRRGYQRTGVLMEYPLSAAVGTPKFADLKIERLEKYANAV
ncbi:MAG: GNAT family N-acetyltransferase [Pseudomonas sp.]|uniref:GNAT family N-acetyltransferase n=1 Tax=Pseudomonas sp. TaxID=306 RepID=UPI003396C6D9